MDSDKQPSQPAAGTERPSDVYDLLAWFEVNKQKLAVAAVLAVVVGFALYTVRHLKSQKEAKANDALLALKPALIPQTNTPPPQASAFAKVAQDFAGTSAAERAQYYAATILFGEGNYADAETAFNKFLSDHQESPWTPAAAYGLAAAQEAQGKDAQPSYQNVVTRYPNSAVADSARLAMAAILERKNQPEQALSLYNQLAAPPPGSAPGTMGNPDAIERKDALLRKFPQLDTNRIVSAAASTPVMTTALSNAAVAATLSVRSNAAPATNPAPAKAQ